MPLSIQCVTHSTHIATKGYYPLITCLRHIYSANPPPGDFGSINSQKQTKQHKNTAERRGLRLSAAAFVYNIQNSKMSAAALKPPRMGAAALSPF